MVAARPSLSHRAPCAVNGAHELDHAALLYSRTNPPAGHAARSGRQALAHEEVGASRVPIPAAVGKNRLNYVRLGALAEDDAEIVAPDLVLIIIVAPTMMAM